MDPLFKEILEMHGMTVDDETQAEYNCEKCGEEMGEKLVGDELLTICPECGHVNH